MNTQLLTDGVHCRESGSTESVLDFGWIEVRTTILTTCSVLYYTVLVLLERSNDREGGGGRKMALLSGGVSSKEPIRGMGLLFILKGWTSLLRT